MISFNNWAARHPLAAAELVEMLTAQVASGREAPGKEAKALQQVRLIAARQGALAWRNNVGATPASVKHTCPSCGLRFEVQQRPVRYGLANDSAQLNAQIKSSDLILAIPRVIRPQDVGRTIAQFGAVETKRPGWRYTGRGGEAAQAAWLALIEQAGGFAVFSTGELEL